MNDDTTRFQNLLRELQAGSQEAARELLVRYGSHVLRCIRVRLPRRIRPQYDSIDFAQLIWKSVFTDPQRFGEIDSPEHFERLLAGMVRNKVCHIQRHLDTQKNNIVRQVPLDEEDADTHPASRDPTPSDVAVFREQWRELEAGGDERLMQVIELRYEGNTWEEIAARLDINESTARKVIDRWRKRKQAADSAPPAAPPPKIPPLPRTA